MTENGLSTRDDDQRIRYLADHLRELKKAADGGAEVRGYFHWSALPVRQRRLRWSMSMSVSDDTLPSVTTDLDDTRTRT